MAILIDKKEVDLILVIKTITSNTTGEVTDDVVVIKSEINNSAPIEYTLPPANRCKGKLIRVMCELAESYCNVKLTSGDEFKGTTAYPISLQAVGEYGVFISDGLASWYLCEHNIS